MGQKEIKLTLDRVKKAHKEGCADVKKVLETLCPEAFGDIDSFPKEAKNQRDSCRGTLYRTSDGNGPYLSLGKSQAAWDFRSAMAPYKLSDTKIEGGHVVIMPNSGSIGWNYDKAISKVIK